MFLHGFGDPMAESTARKKLRDKGLRLRKRDDEYLSEK
jgi:hypothetical protein